MKIRKSNFLILFENGITEITTEMTRKTGLE